MTVGIKGHGDACMTQTLLNDLWVYPITQELAGVEMAQVMKSIAETGTAANGTPGALQVRRVDALPYPAGKDNRLVSVSWSEGQYCFLLAPLVFTQETHRLVVQVNHPSALGLRG